MDGMLNGFAVLCMFLSCVIGTQVRLTGDTSDGTGAVEIFYKGEWYKVDQRYMNDPNVKVICRMLGYVNSGIAVQLGSGYSVGIFGTGSSRIIADDFRCTGNETDITQCKNGASWTTTSSSTAYISAISCEASQLRLADSTTPGSGRVEISIKGGWQTICDAGFDNKDARVVCAMLGYNTTGIAIPFGSSTFGQGFGVSVLTNLDCIGDERDIKLCGATWSNACNHRADAGVKCAGTAIRLVNGVDPASGRVEIENAGRWGTICGDSYFEHRDVMVICRMLGYNNTGAFGHGSSFYGEGSGPSIASNPKCDGSEDDIAKCPTLSWLKQSHSSSCNHDHAIGVNCNGRSKIRLVDGTSDNSGRLEIYHNGHWGTVHSANFDKQDLMVVCKMLNFEYTENAFFKSNFYGNGVGEVSLKSLQCYGYETDIGQCDGTWWPSTKTESHSYDVGVNCDGKIPIRLVGGHTNATGRVELLHNGHYATLCSSGFDRMDLIVVCRMLGFEQIPQSAYWHTGAYFGEGLGEILASGLQCNGDENTIGNCGGSWPASSSCHHSDDVSVSCDGTSEMLRLIGGRNNYSGRVEILHHKQWGRICSYDFDREDAVVLCRILGYKNPETAVVLDSSNFGGKGNGTVILSQLRCNGLEDSIEQCNPQWLPSTCNYYDKDVALDCCPSCSAAPIIG